MRFTTFFIIIFSGTFMMWAPQSAAQEEVYRWVDENGVVHFGDRAPEQSDAEKVSIPQSHGISAQPSADAAAVDPTDAQDPQPSVAQQLRDERAEARREREENAKVTAKNCTKARDARAITRDLWQRIVEAGEPDLALPCSSRSRANSWRRRMSECHIHRQNFFYNY